MDCPCHKIEYSEAARYLGVVIDNEFKMKKHVYNLNSKLRTLHYQLNMMNAGNLPMTTKVTIYFSLVDSILRYGVTLYTYAPNYVLKPLKALQRRIIKLLFNRRNVNCLSPEELSLFVNIYSNFFEEKFRQLNQQPYALRVQHFNRPQVATIQYGQRRLEYIIPTLLNKYCQDFLNEENLTSLKKKIKTSIRYTN